MAGADDETSPEDGEPSPGRDDRQQPPSRASQAGVIDELVAARIREHREQAGMSQSELGRRMAALGWPWHPQTVQRVEGNHRKVSIGEAEALARILDTNVLMLMTAGQEASLAHLLGSTAWNVRRAWAQIVVWTGTLSHQHRQLGTTVGEAERSPFKNSENVAYLLEEAREALAMTAEGAIAEGLAQDEEMLAELQAMNHPGIEDECY